MESRDSGPKPYPCIVFAQKADYDNGAAALDAIEGWQDRCRVQHERRKVAEEN